ncbi:MAG: aminotransferase class I/II-fold pyridoxal phosphate-dependent enzyme [Acidobacteriota bacterium]|nr:aminotransferase class I/II-fold pyridoxal phosphate-dependent enzyme [Acidobacteriota bacterium]
MVRRLAILGGTTTWGDVRAALRQLAVPGRLVEGPALPAYERAFADRVGAAHAVAFAHGRVGLYGLLRALGIGEGDEVLVPVPTHIVVPNAVRYAGARPVYVDCRLNTYNTDLEEAGRSVGPRTRAILVQHTFGNPADLDAVLAFAERHGIEVVEDCVHALGATYAGRPVGSFGRAAFFSTEETKTISTTMGGVAVTDDGQLAAALRAFQAGCAPPSRWLVGRYLLKLIGYHVLTQPHLHRLTRPLYELAGRRNPLPGPTTEVERTGRRPPDYEQRFSNAQAVLGLRQLRRLEGNVAHRRRIARAYAAAGLKPPALPRAADPALVRFPVWVSDRETAVRALSARTVVGLWFTSVLEEAASPQHGGYEDGSCPNAEAAARHLINLPTHQRVREADARALAELVRAVDAG